MALENQRYGRNKSTLIDSSYIDSGEYRRKFDSISDNEEVNKTLYQCAKTALKHRSGTKLEDMYWIDGDTGKVIASALDEQEESSVVKSEKRDKMIMRHKNVYAIHTHPASMPPSVSDFNLSFDYGYGMGVVACHDGKIFKYLAKEHIDEFFYEVQFKKFIRQGLSDYDAQIATLNKLKEDFDIRFWEVF